MLGTIRGRLLFSSECENKHRSRNRRKREWEQAKKGLETIGAWHGVGGGNG